ncbi:Tubby-like, C-terminal [Sesbania bispinosa]|nr:Tubby-like, C-terminal [Sesbania bispinosa]
MAKVRLHQALSSSATSSHYTIWMKSLVLNGKGLTVYDSNGQIVYRVDNYNSKGRHEVYLMDFKGSILFTILRKKFKWSTFREGYRYSATENHKTPSFLVRKASIIPRSGASFYEASLGLDENKPYCYKIQSSTFKSGCKILDQFGGPVAELERKKATCGVDLGDDVLMMIVEPNIDLSLIMGLVVAYCHINCTI